MKRQSLFAFGILVSMLLGVIQSNSQNIFVKVTDQSGAVLLGTSTMTGFINQTEVLSFGQESSSCGFNSGGQGGCLASTGNFIYNFLLDPTITDYRRALYEGRIWRKVEFSFISTSGGGQPFTYEKILLEDVYVTGLQEGVEGTNRPTIQVKLDPSKITWTYIPQNSNGSSGTPRSYGYNRVTNTSL